MSREDMDPEDELLRALAETARGDEQAAAEGLDHRLDRLCAGDLPAAEEAVLRAEAARSNEARRAYEAFRPLGREFRATVVERLRRELPTQRAPATATPPSSADVLHPRRWRHGTFTRWAVPAALAAAAALALVIGRPADHPSSSLPGYQLVLTGDTQLQRSPQEPPSDVRRLTRGNRFELVLRPDAAVADAVDARFFLARGDELRPWPIPAGVLEIDPRFGTVRVVGRVGDDILLPAGAWTLIAAVGRSEDLPTAAEVRTARGSGVTSGPGWRLLEVPIEVD